MSVMGIGPGRLFGPISDVTGFSERDGLTHLEIQRRMREKLLELIAAYNTLANNVGNVESTVSEAVSQAVAAAENAAASAEMAAGTVFVAYDSVPQALARAVAAGGGIVLVPPGNHVITEDLVIPKGSIYLSGCGAYLTKISSANGSKIVVTGGNQVDNWNGGISEITLNGVGVVLGNTENDWGNGFSLSGVEIMNTNIGLLIKYKSWGVRVTDCRIHNCETGVKQSFAGLTGVGSGANMSYVSTMIFNNTTGFWQDGATADGWNTHFIGCDIENNGVGIYLTNVGDGALDISACHMELNQVAHVRANSGSIFINGVWMQVLRDVGTRVAAFDLSGTAKVKFLSGRFQWAARYMLKIDSTAEFYLDPDSVLTLQMGADFASVFGNPAVAGSLGGFRLPVGKGGKIDLSNNVALSRSPSVYTQVAFVQNYNVNSWELKAHIDFSGAEAGNTIHVLFGPSGTGGTIDTPVPATATACEVVVRLTASSGTVTVVFSNGTTYHGRVALTHTPDLLRYIGIRNDGGAAMTMTMSDATLNSIA